MSELNYSANRYESDDNKMNDPYKSSDGEVYGYYITWMKLNDRVNEFWFEDNMSTMRILKVQNPELYNNLREEFYSKYKQEHGNEFVALGHDIKKEIDILKAMSDVTRKKCRDKWNYYYTIRAFKMMENVLTGRELHDYTPYHKNPQSNYSGKQVF